MTKTDYLEKLRNCPSTDILDIVTSYMRKKIPATDISSFEGAYDHRKAELIMNRLYSEVPTEIWRRVY
ncbi:hemolysin [Candidatus Pantoea deserta]|uniref:Hemolysin n=1 Tax=Candidatus Pantoea deserta TaxID=1869313 RepID=A0A3N4P942_9GAMM|nr:Hha/YmoA family nucleoid-associated regulatory protein [Pantoea deserta]RPE01277.1 hemolysin [Pantoea deserta]